MECGRVELGLCRDCIAPFQRTSFLNLKIMPGNLVAPSLRGQCVEHEGQNCYWISDPLLNHKVLKAAHILNTDFELFLLLHSWFFSLRRTWNAGFWVVHIHLAVEFLKGAKKVGIPFTASSQLFFQSLLLGYKKKKKKLGLLKIVDKLVPWNVGNQSIKIFSKRQTIYMTRREPRVIVPFGT